MNETVQRPDIGLGLRHVALFVYEFEACEKFYVDLLGMQVEWRPDTDNVYLTSTQDNLALHRINEPFPLTKQRLDHIGFMLTDEEVVDEWYEYLLQYDVKMKTKPKVHRDGAKSFYCYDPDGNTVQMIHHPSLVNLL